MLQVKVNRMQTWTRP